MKGKGGNIQRQHHHPASLEKRKRRGNEKPAVKVAVPEERKIVSPVLVTETVTRVTILLNPLERSTISMSSPEPRKVKKCKVKCKCKTKKLKVKEETKSDDETENEESDSHSKRKKKEN